MAKLWDDRMKRIFAAAPQDYVSWLLPGARFVGKASLELKTLTRTISTDTLYKAMLDDEQVILHVEFQKRSDPNMAKRIWEYNVLATLEHNCPVYSFVIYLVKDSKKDGKIEEPPLEWGLPKYKKVHVFQYTNIKLWELTVETLQEEHLVGLLPLCLLTQNGMKHEVAEDIFKSLTGEKELLTLALTFASMIFEGEDDQQWLKRRVGMLDDIIRDTWFYKDLYKEAKEQIYAEAKEQIYAEAKEESLQEFRLAILDVVQERFPEIVELAKKQIEPIKDSVVLRRLIVKISAAQTTERARQYIEELNKERA